MYNIRQMLLFISKLVKSRRVQIPRTLWVSIRCLNGRITSFVVSYLPRNFEINYILEISDSNFCKPHHIRNDARTGNVYFICSS